MAQPDTQWPSEDEDFDAISDGSIATIDDFDDEPNIQPDHQTEQQQDQQTEDVSESQHQPEVQEIAQHDSSNQSEYQTPAEHHDDIAHEEPAAHEPEPPQQPAQRRMPWSRKPKEPLITEQYHEQAQPEEPVGLLEEHFEDHTTEQPADQTQPESEPAVYEETPPEHYTPDESLHRNRIQVADHDEVNTDTDTETGIETGTETAAEDTSEQFQSAEEPAQPIVSEQPVTSADVEETSYVTPAQLKKVKQPRESGANSTISVLRGLAEFALLAALFILGLWSWQLYTNNKNLIQENTKLKQNPQAVIQQQTDALVSKVGALIPLPAGEQPTVANVSDAAKAKQQSAFFNNAVNGDRLLMYVKAGRAILYRPSTDKIVLVAPLTFSNNAPATTNTNPTGTTPSTNTSR